MKIVLKHNYYNLKKEFENKSDLIDYIESNLKDDKWDSEELKPNLKKATINELIRFYFPGYERIYK